MSYPGLHEAASITLGTLDIVSHEIDVPPEGMLSAWARNLDEEHRGLVLTGRPNNARIGNAYKGMYGEAGLGFNVIKMARLERTFLEARIALSSGGNSARLMIRTCPSPMTPEDNEVGVWPIVTLGFQFGLAKPGVPEKTKDGVDLLINPDNIYDVDFIKRAHPTLSVVRADSSYEDIGKIDPVGAALALRRIVLNSGEVDPYNLETL